jgi:AraC-like DNA-binding protein
MSTRAPQQRASRPLYLTRASVFPGCDYGVIAMQDQDSAPLHTHDFDELVIITGGAGLHVIDNEAYPLIRGDAFVICGDHVHAFRNAVGLRLVNILFARARFDAIAEQCRDIPGFHALFVLEPQLRHTQRFKAKLHLTAPQLNYLVHLVDLMQEELHANMPGSAVAVESLVKLIVIAVCRYYSTTDTGSCRALVRVSKAIRHLEDHYAESVTLLTLARVANMPFRSFRRAFKQATGCAPSVYLLRLRIERAAELLTDADANVTTTAFDVGFDNSSYFTRQFRKVMGVTPREYMARQRALHP